MTMTAEKTVFDERPTEKNTEIPGKSDFLLSDFVRVATLNKKKYLYWFNKFYYVPEKFEPGKGGYPDCLKQYTGKHEIYYLR